MNAGPRASSVKLFNMLNWIPFYKETVIAKWSLAYKRLDSKLPNYLMNTLIPNGTRHTRATRYRNFNLLCPRYKRETEGGSTFVVTTCKAWNNLPLELRKKPTVQSFRSSLRKSFLENQRCLAHFY